MLFDPLAQTIAAYDRFSARYSAQWFDSPVVDDFLGRFLDLLDETSVVLDAGCGSGREVRELVNRGIDCLGIDLSYETVKRARLNVGSGYFRVMDVRNLEYPDRLFDGVLCIAVLHHLFDRDFKKALLQFLRVTKPGGVVGLTIRLGNGYTTDKLGRSVVQRDKGSVESLLLSLGFTIIDSRISMGDNSRQWLQLLLKNDLQDGSDHPFGCAFCKTPLFLKENRTAHAPIAASVLWGDELCFVTLDVAPMVEGHLLLVTNEHVLSALGTSQDLARLSFHKTQIDHVLKKAFKRKPVFLEHGSVLQSRDPCIEHAHLHAMPLKGDLRSVLRKRLGPLVEFRSLFRADEVAQGAEYLAYEDKRGHIYLKMEGISHLPSQFMRQIVASHLSKEEYLWVPCAFDDDTRQSFNRTLEKLIDVLDADILSREIISDIPQEIRYKLGSFDRGSTRLSKTGRLVASKLLSGFTDRSFEELVLDEIGERGIVDNILTPYFDSGSRGATYIGDDAAVFPWNSNRLLATSDHCPRPVFFQMGIQSYEAYGWLSVAISVSDIAAMGGEPHAILLNTEMPPDMRAIDYLLFIEGVSFAASTYGARVIGGNIREAKEFAAATTVLGGLGRSGALRRDTAQPGQALYVVGEMGLFWSGVFERFHKLLLPLDEHNKLEAGLFFPEAKLAAAQLLAATGIVGACMDASDGPTEAIRSLARASGCDLVVDADAISPSGAVALVARYLNMDPIALMFTWGNFELVFTAKETELQKSIGADLAAHKIVKIGQVRAGRGRALVSSRGTQVEMPRLSVEQFSGARKQSIEDYEELIRNSAFAK